MMKSHTLILNCVLLFSTTLAIDTECDNFGDSGVYLTKRSSKNNIVSSGSGLEIKQDEGLGRSFRKPNLPLPTEVLDELFGRRLFNTTMNYIVPMFHVSLPLHTDSGSTVHLAMQAFLGLFSAIAWIATIAIPLLLTELKPFGLRKRSSDFGNGFSYSTDKLKSLFTDEISTKIGLGWDPCFCKTVCEAHRTPKRYGLLAVPFLVLFPPLLDSDFEIGRYQPFDLTQKRRKAAWDGLHSKEFCGAIYPCFFDVLDLTKYLYSLF